MEFKLDKKDKRILFELDVDARQPLSDIAKKVGLSRESILYRLKKYKEQGIIRNFLTVLNLSKLGFSHVKVFVKLHSINSAQESELIKDLCANPSVSWVASCDGEYSLIFGVKFRSLPELSAILKEIKNKHSQFIMHEDSAFIISANHFYRDYLIGRKATTERNISWGGIPQPVKLNPQNTMILDLLCENPRASAVEIAQKIGLSSDSIIKKIKQLQSSGIIEHYMIWPDVNKLCGLYYKVLINLKGLSSENEMKLIEYCRSNPNIVYSVNTMGPWQFELDIEVEDINAYRKLIMDFISQFSDIVTDYTSLNIYNEYKFRFFEKEVFNKG